MGSSVGSRYERRAYQFLLGYRFLSYAMAVMLTQLGPLSDTPLSDLELNIVLAALGIYTLLWAFSPLRWYQVSTVTYIILLGDFAISILLVVFTNGLNSYFLLYSLNPIIAAALFFEEKIALSLAASSSVILSISHLALNQYSNRFSWITQGYNLTLLIIYTLFCLVAASVPYRINLNVRRRIESEAIIEERRRIARELHDGIAQSLGYLSLKTKATSDSVKADNKEKAINGLVEIKGLVQDTYEHIRQSIDHLSMEGSLPMIPVLRKYIRTFSQDTKIQVYLDAPNSSLLSPMAELQLIRIVQEALTNVRKHANASQVRISLKNSQNMVQLSVIDNGQGFIFSQGDEKSSSGYHGLSIIRERAEGLGGNLVVSTAPGKGTEISVSLPIEKVRI